MRVSQISVAYDAQQHLSQLALSPYLRVEAFDFQVRDQEFDGLLIDLVLPYLAEVDHVVEKRGVGHAGQTVWLERRLDEIHFLLRNV